MNRQHSRALALQASGEYMMNHLTDILEMVEDTHSRRREGVLDENTLTTIERQVKTIAKALTFQSEERVTHGNGADQAGVLPVHAEMKGQG